MSMLTTFFSAILLLYAVPTTAEIKSIKIQNDKRPKIVFEQFEFTRNGHASISVSSLSVISPLSAPDLSRFAFFICPRESERDLEYEQSPGVCILDSNLTSLVFTFKDLANHPHSSFHYPVKNPGDYLLQFANCNPASLVTMDARIELYNTDDAGTKDFLSSGLRQLPCIYSIFAFIYLCLLGLWVLICFKNRHRRYFHRIHILMGVLLVVTVLSLLFAAADSGYVKVTGTPHGWNVVFDVFQFFRSLLLNLVVVLISVGWSFLKPKPMRLAKEKMFLLIFFMLQSLDNVACIMIRETGRVDKRWETWRTVHFVVQAVFVYLIHIPMFLTSNWLREAFKADSKAARILWTLFLPYTILVSLYFLCKVSFWFLKISGENKYWWVYNIGTNSAEEIMNLVLYMLMFYMLRPVEKNKNFVLDLEDEVEVPEKNEEFVLVCISMMKYEEAAKMGLWDENRL